jgi:hypothetical protein
MIQGLRIRTAAEVLIRLKLEPSPIPKFPWLCLSVQLQGGGSSRLRACLRRWIPTALAL